MRRSVLQSRWLRWRIPTAMIRSSESSAKSGPSRIGRTWLPWAAWLAAVASLMILGSVRVSARTEFAVTSLAILPVMLLAWVSGRCGGLFAAALATAMWLCADLVSEIGDLDSWVLWANTAARLATYSLVALLVARVQTLLARERAHATRDELTGLANRRMFFEAGEREVGRSRRYQHPAAVLFLDLDHFKQLNDSLGHSVGDAALCAAAQALRAEARTADTVARFGGDEFAVLLPEVDQVAAHEAAARIATAVNAAVSSFPGVSASVGVAWFGAPPPFEEMVRAADAHMYRAKRQRRLEAR
jgi:diguanylate cyclase (GGDEF)-like protein